MLKHVWLAFCIIILLCCGLMMVTGGKWEIDAVESGFVNLWDRICNLMQADEAP